MSRASHLDPARPRARPQYGARAWAVAGALLGSVLAAGAAHAADDEALAGKAKAAQICVVCHGTLGVSAAPDAPHLAGQPAIYLSQQLRAFRDGRRSHEVMNVIAKPLTNEEIRALAAWYSSLKVTVEAP